MRMSFCSKAVGAPRLAVRITAMSASASSRATDAASEAPKMTRSNEAKSCLISISRIMSYYSSQCTSQRARPDVTDLVVNMNNEWKITFRDPTIQRIFVGTVLQQLSKLSNGRRDGRSFGCVFLACGVCLFQELPYLWMPVQ